MPLSDLESLKTYLDGVHIRQCLLAPYHSQKDYPLVEARELLPSFEVDLFEYKNLPGYSLVALERPLSYFSEVFQFDILHSPVAAATKTDACPLVATVQKNNLGTMSSRLPKRARESFEKDFCKSPLHQMDEYERLTPYLLQMERAHVLSLDAAGHFHLSGVYGSLPSDLDTEMKRFGIRIGKFKPGDNALYDRNRLFVYQYLMELYGFPMASERRTSAALFSRRLFRMGESFLIRVQGQSDRTITTLYSHPKAKFYPRVEKIALISVGKDQKQAIRTLEDRGFFVDREKRVVILRVLYRQHKFNPQNIRQDRALSVFRQEVIHPETGEAIRDLNLIKDTTNMIFHLNDIVRGEYAGQITFKRNEPVQDTDTHDKRLKFLHTWLGKHQRRIIGYSDQFFADVSKVLDGYLLSPDNYDIFKQWHDLYQEVWSRYSYIQQARKAQTLETLQTRQGETGKISYLDMLREMNEILNDLKFESVTYFDTLVSHVLKIGKSVLNDQYLLKNYATKRDDALTEYGIEVKRQYSRLVSQLDELTSIRKSRTTQPGG